MTFIGKLLQEQLNYLNTDGINSKGIVKGNLATMLDAYGDCVLISEKLLNEDTIRIMEDEYKRVSMFKDKCFSCVPDEVIEAYKNMLEVLKTIDHERKL